MQNEMIQDHKIGSPFLNSVAKWTSFFRFEQSQVLKALVEHLYPNFPWVCNRVPHQVVISPIDFLFGLHLSTVSEWGGGEGGGGVGLGGRLIEKSASSKTEDRDNGNYWRIQRRIKKIGYQIDKTMYRLPNILHRTFKMTVSQGWVD